MTKATVANGEFVFSSPLARYRFMELAEGKEIKLEINEKPTEGVRKYFEGCLVPAFFYSHPHSGWDNFSDAREVLKLEFSPGVREVTSLEGEPMKIAPSTSDLSKKRFELFVEAIVEWMMENGVPYEALDSEEYLRWRDTNYVDLVYPPLARLKATYEAAKGNQGQI